MASTEVGPPPAETGLIGRAAELTWLAAQLDAALSGHVAVVLVSGEAGIGKTRLAQSAAERAQEAGASVLWASAWEHGGVPAYWHWVQILRAHAATRPPQALVGELGSEAYELARLVPEPRAGVHLSVKGGAEGEQARFRLHDAVTTVLARAARRQPLVIVLDDLHAADRSSLTLLRFAVSELRVAPLLVIAVTRYASRDAEVGSLLTDLGRQVPTLALRGLEREAVAELLTRVVGSTRASDLASEVHRRSGGNPLFVGELVQLIAAGGGVDPGTVPDSVRALIERRLEPLPQPLVALLRSAAVVGEDFGVGMLSAVTSTAPEEVLALLDRAVTEGIVRPSTRPGPPTFSFTHALMREVLYAGLSLPGRAASHLRVAEAIEVLYPHEPPAAELAHHFIAASALQRDDRAAHYAELAGSRAAAALAFEEAARHYTNALAVLDPDDQERRRGPLLLALGDARLRAGNLQGAREAFEQAAELARREGRSELLAHAALGFASGLDGFEVRLFDHAQITLLEEALSRLGPEHAVLRSWTLARLSVALTFAEAAPDRLRLVDGAVAIARREGDQGALSYALAARCDALAGPEHVAERLHAADEIVRLAQATGDRGVELLGRRNRVIALLESGDIPGVDAEIARYEMVAKGLHQPLYEWYVELWRGMRALMDGRLAACREHTAAAAAIGARADSHNAALNVEVQMWNTLLAEGRWEEAGASLGKQLELASGIYGEPFWVALVAHRAHPTEARATLDRLAASDFSELPRDAVWLASMTYAADACHFLDHAAVAPLLYQLMLPFRDRFAVDAIGAACYGSLSRGLGGLAAVMGRRHEAEEHYAAALRAHRGCGAAALVAETLRDYGAALQSFGDAGDAAALLEEAHAIYSELGLDGRAALVQADLVGPGAPAVNRFCREGEVWTLAFAGRTVRVADAKGLHDIAALLARPGRDVPVAALIARTDPAPAGQAATREVLLRGAVDDDPLLDARARAAYQARLVELRDELDEAERHADLGRAAAAREEMDAIAGELAAALGLSGRSRRHPDAAERARKAVSQRIRNAVKRIAHTHPELAAHLERSLGTGHLCSYRPDEPVDWLLDGP